MSHRVYSHSGNATARSYLLPSLMRSSGKYLIITDNNADINILRTFAIEYCGRAPTELRELGELLATDESSEGIFFCHPDIFRTNGNLYEIRKNTTFTIERGDTITPEACIEQLLAFGYQHDSTLGSIFTYKKEGNILSIRARESTLLIHIEWFDVEIDSIIFSDELSGKHEYRDRVLILRANGGDDAEATDEMMQMNPDVIAKVRNIFEDTHIIVIGCEFIRESEQILAIAGVHISEMNHPGSTSLEIQIPDVSDVNELITLIESSDSPVVIFTRYQSTIEEFFAMQVKKTIDIRPTLSRHIESFLREKKEDSLDADPILFLTDDILARIFVKNRRTGNLTKNLDLLISLKPGDLVVHRDHGIGRFETIREKTLGSLTREYLEILYADGDVLYVPITEVYRISKYLGDNDIELAKLSGKEWENTMKKTDEELQKIAEGILETNARRQLAPGRAFGAHPEKEREFREDFPYEYTPDQLSAIMDVSRDMEAPLPMDRLISGDVGFGKTEVAMNAAYKAILDGTQVALISPLVVLALEHAETLRERMEKFGVRVTLLTRMSSAEETKRILASIRDGSVDVVIGTHRLFSSDVRWRRLGLLIIDEEHKFGVMHKESIKKMRAHIDILSLSATPIPRSLNLALSGLKSISLLTTPPKRKKPIETIIARWNPTIIAESITRELEKNGQVIILMNRIREMESLMQELTLILDDVTLGDHTPRIVMTHGRMHGDEIEDRIHAFKERQYNILLTTTIIENGVNFLSANTILIIDPEEFGLASLHQLRGRVGRKSEQGYCYLLYRKSALSDDEKKRLITLAENNHLGAGFEIAMRDMEIRGAGDVLGIAQSGNSKSIGLPLYFRMLEEKIAALRSAKNTLHLTKIDLDLSMHIPSSFFLSEVDKLNFYREIENIDTLEELDQIYDDMIAGFRGDPRTLENVTNLFLMLRARIAFGMYGIDRVSKHGNYYVFDAVKGMTGAQVKQFLEVFDREKNIVLVSFEKMRIDVRHFADTKDFLQKFLLCI